MERSEFYIYFLFFQTIETINNNTDIAYNVSREAAGGLVSRRDFVNLRHWKEKDGVIVSLGWSVPHPDMPPCKKQVRSVVIKLSICVLFLYCHFIFVCMCMSCTKTEPHGFAHQNLQCVTFPEELYFLTASN